MSEYIMISDYMDKPKYRLSFNKLAMNTFRLDFEDWYQNNLFYDTYLCYSYINNDEIIANVSINKFSLIIEGQNKSAIQLGTVMTDKNYRKQGLSAALINHIIEKYENEYDIIYLFANSSVSEFYPKFGFKKVIESAYELEADKLQKKETFIKKLDKDNQEDYKIIERLTANRQPISQKLGVYNDIWPLLVHCLYQYKDDLYYLEDEDTIVIAKREGERLHIYDVVRLKTVDLDEVIEKIAIPDDKIIELHFVPELCKYKAHRSLKPRPDDILFVRSKNTLPEEILFPMTSQT